MPSSVLHSKNGEDINPISGKPAQDIMKPDLTKLKLPEEGKFPRLELRKEVKQAKEKLQIDKPTLEIGGTRSLDNKHHSEIASGQVKGVGVSLNVRNLIKPTLSPQTPSNSVFIQQEESSFMLFMNKKAREKKYGSLELESIIRDRVVSAISDNIGIKIAVKNLARNVALGSGKDTLDEAIEKIVEEGGRSLLEQIVGQMQAGEIFIFKEDDEALREIVKKILKEKILRELMDEKEIRKGLALTV